MTEQERICHNCGLPMSHRLHRPEDYATYGARGGLLPNGCSYSYAQPETLWHAVLWPAIAEAATLHDVEVGQVVRAVYDHVRA